MARGMSIGDFCKLTPADFGEFVKAATESDERAERTQWETARLIATTGIMPHLKSTANRDPKKLCPLPWDNEKQKAKPAGMSREEADALFEKRIRDLRQAETNKP